MEKLLDHVRHLAIQMQAIEQPIAWYTTHVDGAVSYRDARWALLKFDNVSLALVLPNQHPPHFAVPREKGGSLGTPASHRSGTNSVYMQDPGGNHVARLKLAA